MAAKKWEFTVYWTGVFPIDMLRFDYCWPKTSDDAVRIANSFDTLNPGWVKQQHVAVLCGNQEPTAARWASFGARVQIRQT